MEGKGERDSWSGQLGFILAASASAVGLGNLWRFPSCAAKYGGGIYILFYIIIAATLGVALINTEISIGRLTRLSPSRAFRQMSRHWSWIGILGMIIPAIILPYYCVVGGWVTKYCFDSFAAFFTETSSDFGALVAGFAEEGACTFVFAAATMAFVFLGVRGGIEKSNKFMMPALLLLIMGVVVFVIFQDGMGEGLKYYLVPDVSRLCIDGEFSWTMLAKTIFAALSQVVFSLGLAMGIMITYGSYVQKEDSIPQAGKRIVFCDTFVALMAGIIVIPPALMFGGADMAMKAGPGLMFESLPKVFAAMPCARLVALSFFLLVFFAALTSSISIAETVTSSICDWLRIKRTTGAIITSAILVLGAIPTVITIDFLEWSDFSVNAILLPVVSFFTCIFIGWIVGPKTILDEMGEGVPFGSRFYSFTMRWAAPVLISVVFVTTLLSGLKVISL